ncbi:hypothetical protein H0E87_008934 [Populus deltoides]|uniref:Uncharacterized protein n=1 Tax=Populus deltoides TaxID=3696 RepID=A0A8T2Z2H9_POPDE|nr:hypothetical protein H0E87_008934 [Populus deltoides]
MAEDQDWDLYACLDSLTFDDDDDDDGESNPFSFQNLASQPRNNNCLQELQDSYKPFLPSFTTSTVLQGDHTHPCPTHRNSLAGSTRNKVQQPAQKPENKESEHPISADRGSCSSPLSATSLSPRTTLSAPIYNIEAVGNE